MERSIGREANQSGQKGGKLQGMQIACRLEACRRESETAQVGPNIPVLHSVSSIFVGISLFTFNL